MVELIRCNLPNIQSLCRAHGVSRLALIGSALGERFREDSDVDFIADFPEGFDFMQLVRLIDGLSALLDRSVDVVPREWINNPYREKSMLSVSQEVFPNVPDTSLRAPAPRDPRSYLIDAIKESQNLEAWSSGMKGKLEWDALEMTTFRLSRAVEGLVEHFPTLAARIPESGQIAKLHRTMLKVPIIDAERHETRFAMSCVSLTPILTQLSAEENARES